MFIQKSVSSTVCTSTPVFVVTSRLFGHTYLGVIAS